MTPTFLYCLLSLLAGAAASFGIFQLGESKRQQQRQRDADQLLESARERAETERSRRILDAKEAALAFRAEAESELAEQRRSLLHREQHLDRRDEILQQQEESLRKQQRGLEASQTRLTIQMQGLAEQKAKLEQTLGQQIEVLEQASGMSREEAGNQLLQALEQQLEQERGSVLLRHRKALDNLAQNQAREILLTAIQRYSSAHTADSTTSTVDVPTDDMKGRIIGREGRNIRAFEKATGVDLIIDDTPGVVIVSGFDPVRREVARQSLNTLIADGRIHPIEN